MSKLRVIHYVGSKPQLQLRFEERLLGRVSRTGRPACLFYCSDPCIVLGRNNKPEAWVNAAQAAADGIPVLRRITGGGAVFLNRDVLNYSFTIPRSLLEDSCVAAGLDGLPATSRYLEFFRRLVIRALRRAGGKFELSGISDISLNGRKISGNAQRISAHAVLHHGTLMLRCPLAEIERYLPVPPNRPLVAHGDFVTGLAEEGISPGAARLQEWLAGELAAALAMDLT